MDYFPNPVARALKTGRTNIIGLVMPDLTQPLFPIFARSIEQAAQQAGLAVLIADSMDDAEAQQAAMERLVRPEQRGPQEKGASGETPFICFGWATGLFDHCLC
jgi:LacI family transcriptional regulator